MGFTKISEDSFKKTEQQMVEKTYSVKFLLMERENLQHEIKRITEKIAEIDRLLAEAKKLGIKI